MQKEIDVPNVLFIIKIKIKNTDIFARIVDMKTSGIKKLKMAVTKNQPTLVNT